MLKKEKVLLISSLALILSSGHAFCMPTEGVVVKGAVTNVDNPAEVMKAEANSIVNWWSFDINKNEKVVFDTQNYTVLNKVLNGQESKILGSLSDIGNGRLILFNPSGVVIGDGATINVNDLTLTTLEMPSENLESFASNGSTFNQTSVGQRFINIGKNATFDINKALQIYAGGIYIADGVKIIPNNKNEELSRVVLGTGIQVTDDHHFNIHNKTNPNDNDAGFFGSGYRDNRYEAVNGPNITINGTLIGTPETPVTNVKMIANQIDINSSEIYAGNKTKYSLNNDEDDLLIVSRRNTINNTNLWNHSGNLYVISGNHLNTVRKYNFWNEGTNWYFYGLNHSFPLIIKNSTLVTNTEDIKLYAPQFDIQNTAISSNRDLYMYAVYDSYYYQTSNTWKAYTVYKTDWTCLVKLDDETRNKSELRGNANLMGSYVREDSGRSYTEDFANYKDILFKKNNTGAPTVNIPKRVPEEKPAEEINNQIAGTQNISISESLNNKILQQFSPEERALLYAIDKGEHIEDPRAVEIIKRYHEIATTDTEINKYYLPSYSNVSGSFATGGMYISDIKTSKINSDGNINVTLNIYNRTPIPGILEVYDKNGNIVSRNWIDGHERYSESVSDALEDVGQLLKDVVNGTALSYKSEALSELNEFSGKNTIIVPEGGRIRITNNEDESPELMLHNNLLHLIDWIFTAKDVIDFVGNADTKEFRKLTTDALVNKILYSIKDWDAETKDKFVKKICQNGAENGYDLVTEMLGFDIDVRGLIEDSLYETFEAKKLETAAIKDGLDIVAAISDVIHIQDGMFLINSALNKAQYQRYREKLKASKPIEYRFFNGE